MIRIIIAAHKGTGVLSRMIAWQTRSYDGYSHVSLVLPDRRQIEAWWDGVHINTAFNAHGGDVDFFTVEASDDAAARMVAFAEQEVGAKYDFWADLCFATRLRPAPDDKRWFCSELAYAALAAGGINLFRATQPWEVSPGMLVRSPLLLPILNPVEVYPWPHDAVAAHEIALGQDVKIPPFSPA